MTRPGYAYCSLHQALLVALLGGLELTACSSTDNSSGGAGGSVQTGGQSANGGSKALGGSNTGGSGNGVTATGNGGASSVGGSTGKGGESASSSGGSVASSSSSAASNTGGNASGGQTAKGGASNGGASAVGGSAAGGVSATSSTGTKAVGGSAAGGVTSGTTSGPGGGAGAASGGSTSKGGNANAGAGQGGASTSSSNANCANRAVSLSANGTASASDTAYAHVEVDLKTDLPIDNAKRTIEFWAFIKTTDWVGEKNEVYYYGGSANAGAFGLDFGTNPVANSSSNHATLNPITGGGFNDDSTKDLGITSASDQWVHIAMTWDGTALKTYVNGLPKITTNGSGVTALATGQSVLIIGCNPTNNNCFNGYFDEFRVWNVARTDVEIKDNYNKALTGGEAGLVAYLKFDEAPGATTTADSVTTTGHTAHPGTLKADTAAHNPTFVTPATPLSLVCP